MRLDPLMKTNKATIAIEAIWRLPHRLFLCFKAIHKLPVAKSRSAGRWPTAIGRAKGPLSIRCASV